MRLKELILAVGLALALPGLAAAAVITFDDGTTTGDAYSEDGFLFDPARIVNGSGAGNCSVLGGSCLAFNQNETTTMTTDPSGGAFNLESLTFVLLGEPAELSVFNFSINPAGVLIVNFDVGDPLGSTTIAHNTVYTYDFGGTANGVTSILFDNTGTGNARIGSIVATAAVPIPAAGFLLIGALGGLGALRRRRKAT